MLNSSADSKFNVKILSLNNHSYLQIKLPEAKFIFSLYTEKYITWNSIKSFFVFNYDSLLLFRRH